MRRTKFTQTIPALLASLAVFGAAGLTGCGNQAGGGLGGSASGQASSIPTTPPVDNAQRQQAYEQQLEAQRGQRAQDVKGQFEQTYGRDKIAMVTITGVTGDSAAATNYLNRKLFRAAYHDYEQSAKRAQAATKSNQDAAKQQAVQQHQQTWGSNSIGPTWVQYQYKVVEADLPYPRVQQGTTANGTYVYYVAPVINLDEFSKRFTVGNITSIDQGNRAVQIQSLLPDPVPDIDLEELLIKHGKSGIATLRITGAAGDEGKVTYYIEQQVVKLDPQVNLETVGPKRKGKDEYELYVAPASDLKLLSERVTFGTVTNTDSANRVLTVAAKLPENLPERPSAAELHAARMKEWEDRANKPSDWDKEPRKDEDVYIWAMRVIKGGNPFAADAAYIQLSSMEPDDEHLKEISAVLVATLNNASSGTRLDNHLQAMVVWKTDETTKAIIGLLSETNSFTRASAIKALGKLPSKQAATAVAGRMSDFFDGKDASAALRQMGIVAEDTVLRLAESPAPTMRAEAYSILAEIGNEKTLTKLKSLHTKDRNRDSKAAAKAAIDILKERVDAEKEAAGEKSAEK